MATIEGRVIDQRTRAPLPGLIVEAIARAEGDRLGRGVTNADGHFSMEVDQQRFVRLVSIGEEVGFAVAGPNREPFEVSEASLWSAREPERAVTIVVRRGDPVPEPPPARALTVQGVVTDAAGIAAMGVGIEAWDHNVAGRALVAQTTTGADGRYALTFDSTAIGGKQTADLEVVALGAPGAVLGSSGIVFGAPANAVVDLVVDRALVPTPSELDQLLGAVQPSLAGRGLSEVTAAGVGYLAGRTGWDPRLVAMAAQASRLSNQTQVPQEHYYALMRAGLPGEPEQLHRLADSAVVDALKSGIAEGIIAPDADIEATVRAHGQAAAEHLRALRPEGMVSSLGEMLALRLDGAQQATMVESLRAAGDDTDKLWTDLEARGFDAPLVRALEVDAVLGAMTRQNAPLVGRLTGQFTLGTAAELADKGLYKAGAWHDLIGSDVPQGLTRETYAEGLALQVQQRFPTRVTASLVRERAVDVGDATEEVATFLTARGETAAIGVAPVRTWDGFDGLTAPARDGLLKVERLYQVTPSNGAMQALSATGIDSARQVARYSPDGFVAAFGDKFPSAMEAKLTHAKASQVHGAALTIATAYLTQRTTPNIFALTGASAKQAVEPHPGIAAAATLEDLFGNMDFCSCDHCRSVLSPAAYLVELLELLDMADVPHSLDNPQEVLLDRRPDLAHLALSCENTQVVLPYLDVVLEILEHWVVNGSLNAFAGHDVAPGTESADLLADREFVQDAAYNTTKAAVYPGALPFDAPLEHLRALVEVWDTTLPAALDILGDAADARREWLLLNAAEHAILTDVHFRSLPEYFGEPATATIEQLNDAVGNAKAFCRRTGIAYTELAEILNARFVNPGSALASLLTNLHVSLRTIQDRFDGTLADPAFLAMLPAGLDVGAYGGNVLAWLDSNRALIMGMITLTDMTTADDPHECDFGKVELRFALPDLAANRLDDLAYHRLHRFLRLSKKLAAQGWKLAETDTAVTAFLGVDSASLTAATLDAAFSSLLDRLAGFLRLAARLDLSPKQRAAWLGLFDHALEPDARHRQLASLLRIGTTDLATLLELTGLNPFADDLGSVAPSLSKVVDAAAAVKASRLKVSDLDYLLRHSDPAGKLTPPQADLQRDLVSLRTALAGVDAELAAPAGTTDLGAAAVRMARVYDASVIDRFLGFLSGTTTYTAPLTSPEEVLPAPLATIAPTLRIDPFDNVLASTGPVSEGVRAAVAAAADGLVLSDVENITAAGDLANFVADLKTALQALHDAAEVDLAAFGNDYPELRTLYDTVVALSDPGAQAAAIVAGILPGLRAALRNAVLRTTLATVTKATPELVDVLVSGPKVLHADGNAAAGIVSDFSGLEAQPDLTVDGSFELLLNPPVSAEYLLYVAAPPGTQVSLDVAGTTAIAPDAVDADGELRSAAGIAMAAGGLVPANLTLSGLPAGARAELRWRSAGLPQAAIPAARLYLASAANRAQRSLVRFRKAVTLAGALGLTPAEVADLGGVREDTAGVWSALAVDGSIVPAEVQVQWQRLLWLLWFTAVKAEHEPEENALVSALGSPAAADARGQLVLAGLMGWSEADLNAVLTGFGLGLGELAQLPALKRIATALELVATTQQPAADLLQWVVAAPDGALVRGIRETLKQRMALAAWRESMQSVSDRVRNACRDALVAYILQHATPSPEIQTPDALYEYFLVDVQMDACMQTSRIRLALSTVQLFVNRCLLGLEPRVSPGSINADRWSWMRRYRVWEANRKVFLWPENWVEPELRDGKSPFFRDLESELLKADITQELAEIAYLHYLQKLDDVARPEIVGSFLEPRSLGTTDDDILHVIGRTLGETREHWYRRHEYGYWTPWEKVPLNLEGDVVVPVVWRKRLFVFWTTSVAKAQGDPSKSPQAIADEAWAGAARVDATVTLHRGEYYHGRWTSPKSTETTTPLTFGYLNEFDPAKIRIHTKIYTPDSPPGGPPLPERLELWVGYRADSMGATYYLTFTSPNAAPFVRADDAFWVYLGREAQLFELGRNPRPPVDANSWVYPDREFTVRVEQPVDPKTAVPMQVLTKGPGLLDGFRVRPTLHTADNPWEQPVFYMDERSVFVVTGDEQIYRERPPWYVGGVVLGVEELHALPKVIEQAAKPVIPNPRDPVINPGYKVLLPGNDTFRFQDTVFDAGGVARARRIEGPAGRVNR